MKKETTSKFFIIVIMVSAHFFCVAQPGADTKKTVPVLPPKLNFAVEKKAAVAFIDGTGSVANVVSGGTLHSVSISGNGRLELRSAGEKGAVFLPAELAGYPDLKFKGNPSLTTRWGNNLEIAAISTDGRLVRIAENRGWHVYFPAEDAGHAGIRCKGTPSITAQAHFVGKIMSIMAITNDNKLIEFVYEAVTGKWRLRYPAEMAGRADEKLMPFVVQTANAKSSQDVVLVTQTGKLLHLWNDEDNNGDTWHGELPAELAGIGTTQFASQAEIIKHPIYGGQTIAAITKEGKLVTLNYHAGKNWVYDFPCDKAGKPALRLAGTPSLMVSTEISISMKLVIFALDKDKKLVQIYQDPYSKWKVDYPLLLAGKGDIYFSENPAIDPTKNAKAIVCKTNESKYAIISVNAARWKFDYVFD